MMLRITAILPIFLVFNCFSTAVYAQVLVTGVVADSIGHPISGANITTTGNRANGAMRAFALTNEKGQYRLHIGALAGDSIYIKAASLGYTAITVKLFNQSQEYHFQLKVNPQQLPEVRVERPEIFMNRDTINYDVSRFTTAQDRVIGDVLKKLPGVEVTSSGEILYQGKPIQQLTVEGLNLLEAKYGAITQHLPADAVSRVQVIENDQHIKVLDGLVPTDKATINLKLKKMSVTGSMEAGIGFSPFLRQVNLVPMLFNKNFQMVHAFASNNTGADVLSLLQSYQVGHVFQNNSQTNLSQLTHIVSSGIPALQQERWLDNNINQWSSNFLKRMKGDWIAKAGFSYTNDHQSQYTSAITSIYTPGAHPITIVEEQNNGFNTNKAFGSFVFEKNVNKLFFRNNFSATANWNRYSGALNKDNQPIWQRNNIEQRGFSNRLNIKKTVGKQLLDINSTISYSVKPEFLLVSPGPFAEILNDTVPYASAQQQARSEMWYTDHSVGFIKKPGKLTARIKMGFMTGQSSIGTILATIPDNMVARQINDLQFWKWAGYTVIGLTRDFLNGYVSFDLPLQMINLQATQSTITKESRLTWQPGIYTEYRHGNRLKLYGSANRGDTLTDNPASLYESMILINYRTLQRYLPVFQRTESLTARVGVEYRKILAAFWLNAETGIEQRTANFVTISEILPDGTSRLSVLPQKTRQKNWFGVLSFSKVYVPAGTLIRLSLRGSLSNYERILNDEHIRPVNKILHVQSDVINTSSTFIQPALHVEWSFSDSRSESGQASRQFVSQKYNLDVTMIPAKNHQFHIRLDHLRFDQPGLESQFFLDGWYRFVLQKKKKIDIELRCTNLLNRRRYQTLYNDGYLTLENNYQLRPRQLMLVCRMGL